MTHQRVLFTALPDGPDPDVSGRYRLSVFVSPRLTTDNPGDTFLSPTFPDWVDWPATVAAVGWSVVFGDAGPIPAAVVSEPPRSDLWAALFVAPVLVESHAQTPFGERTIRSYPVRNIRDFLRNRYTDVAVNSPTEFPHIDTLIHDDGFGLLRRDLVEGSGGATLVEAVLSANKVITDFAPMAQPAIDFYQLKRFHRPRVSDKEQLLAPISPPSLDFHKAVTTVGQYPPLLRLLGLVVDLTVDLPDGLAPSPTEVRVVPAWTPSVPSGTADSVSVRTRCLIDTSTFRARPRDVSPPDLVDGRVPLDDTDRYTVIQEDLDGAATKVLDFVGNLFRVDNSGQLSSASPETYALPSLRSGGLGVARVNRAPQFHARIVHLAEASDGLDQPDPAIVVDAEDVTRGNRIDIRDTREGRWFSLSARSGAYEFPSVAVPFQDEGWVTAAPTEDTASDLYLQQTLFRWGGWSLAVPRPGARVANTQEVDPPVSSGPGTIDPKFPVRIEPKATPGTLPRLRFGRTYEVRARAVDLAGNSVPLDPGNRDPRATPPITYYRFEPIQTPPVLPHGPRTEGESLERVVLRSNYDTAPPADPVVMRHIVPSRADQLLAEQHGLFDTPYPGSIVNPDSYSTISAYPGLPEPDPDGSVVQSEQGSFETLSEENENDPEDFKKTRFFPVDLVTLPYLPDPLARGAALRFVDHPTGPKLLMAQFRPEQAWPKHRPIRLVLTQAASQGPPMPSPTYDEDEHEVKVPLRKGDVVHVRLSAYLPTDALQKLGLWSWIVDGGGTALRQTVIEGGHWMITPFRTLTLVHAVRQPLTKPEFFAIGNGPKLQVNDRILGQTFVKFNGRLGFSRRSTSRVDIVATWPEFVDRGPRTEAPTPASPPRQHRSIPFTVPGDRGLANPTVEDLVRIGPDSHNDRQEFGDTKHRNVGYAPVATTRFAEYFVETYEATIDYGGGTSKVITLDTDGVVPGSVKVKKKVSTDDDGSFPAGSFGTYREGPHFTVDAGEGKVRILKPAGDDGRVPNGTLVVIDYLVPPIVRPGPGESTPPVVVNVRSTARPSSPKLVYVVPTFGWESTKGPQVGTYQSRRRGNGLRVYLERPWWSSGEGELLGVVLEDPSTPASEALRPNLTRYGVDPVFRSTNTSSPGRPGVLDFQAAVAVADHLTLPGIPGQVIVSGHTVGFDTSRDLWYCDILIRTRSYFPFVRLGLVRYQPDSITDAHLSGIVVTDFAQLAPDRFVSVTPASDVKRRVTVTGQSYSRLGGDASTAKVHVFLEILNTGIGGDMGWEPVGNPVTLDPQPPIDGDSVWSGEITVLPGIAGRKQRLVIEEFERHRTGASPVFFDRLVYSDVIEL